MWTLIKILVYKGGLSGLGGGTLSTVCHSSQFICHVWSLSFEKHFGQGGRVFTHVCFSVGWFVIRITKYKNCFTDFHETMDLGPN